MTYRFVRSVMLAILVGGALTVGPAAANGSAGPYLAARNAQISNDFQAAATYFSRALTRDPSNSDLMESAILAYVGQGDIKRAIAVSRRLAGLNKSNQVANMLLLADAVQNEGYDAALALLKSGELVGPLVDGLTLAWVQVGQGNMTAALATFDKVAAGQGTQAFGLYHKALALAMAGDLEGAEAILSGQTGTSIAPTRRGIIAQSEILSQLERNADALTLIDTVFGAQLDPGLRQMRARLDAGETLPLNSIQSASDGLAEVFFSVANALSGEANDGYTLVYTRVAEYLRPDLRDSILMTAGLLEKLGRYELATAAYDRIPRDDPAFQAAELGRAEALRMAGNTDAAIEVLRQLSESHAEQPAVHVALGDIYRRLSRFEESSQAYDRALAIYGDTQEAPWSLYYLRGITNERLDRWPLAEADFRKALELRPEQPQVLNYLGYSLVELQIKLDEALDMIERAVEARPNDGYITDSLGWVLYRLGRYEEAVGQMERAAELTPVDPVINDHLGDVYWAVGRKREARFQWLRAMSFEPEEEDAARIRRKLEVGLDVVLEEEGAAPIAFANDG
ncbi:MAG: tetratricopeptide repeat protein [Paracoccaceae bacterium]